MLCTCKHRRCDTSALVRTIPETFKGFGLSQLTAFCPQKAMLAGIVYIHSPLHGRMIELFFPHMILDGTPSKP